MNSFHSSYYFRLNFTLPKIVEFSHFSSSSPVLSTVSLPLQRPLRPAPANHDATVCLLQNVSVFPLFFVCLLVCRLFTNLIRVVVVVIGGGGALFYLFWANLAPVCPAPSKGEQPFPLALPRPNPAAQTDQPTSKTQTTITTTKGKRTNPNKTFNS